MGKVLGKCTVFGGLIVFIWGMLSWMILPFHKMTMHKFVHEDQVAKIIKANAPESGMYFLPSYQEGGDDTEQLASLDTESGKEEDSLSKKLQKRSDVELIKKKMKQGPIVVASVYLQGADPDSLVPFIGSLIIQTVGAFLAAWLLLHTKGLKFKALTLTMKCSVILII